MFGFTKISSLGIGKILLILPGATDVNVYTLLAS
jgi:hypothetical protein